MYKQKNSKFSCLFSCQVFSVLHVIWWLHSKQWNYILFLLLRKYEKFRRNMLLAWKNYAKNVEFLRFVLIWLKDNTGVENQRLKNKNWNKKKTKLWNSSVCLISKRIMSRLFRYTIFQVLRFVITIIMINVAPSLLLAMITPNDNIHSTHSMIDFFFNESKEPLELHLYFILPQNTSFLCPSWNSR